MSLAVPAPLRKYQWEGVRFLLDRSSALLADEMGLGKTVQAAMALRSTLREGILRRVLIVVPASLRLNWIHELGRWAPDLTVRALIGDAADRRASYLLPIPVLVASYEQVRLDTLVFLDSRIGFDLVLLDEAQRIKNPAAATSFACRSIRRERAWALTGTPLENRPDDLLSIFRFLAPGLLSVGMSRETIHDRIQPHFLRRTKREVLRELPPIIDQELTVELEGVQREAYEEVWRQRGALVGCRGGHDTTGMLAVITKLKQLCNYEPVSGMSAKYDALQVILENLTDSDDKVLLFSQYVATLRWISERLILPHDVLHGQTPYPKREEMIHRFDRNPGPRMLLVSLRAGGVGLNLQAASTVVLFDRWWNPAVEDQAIQRAHRFGRERPLHVIRLLVTDSVEDRIAAVLEEKRALFEEYVEEAESAEVGVADTLDLKKVLALE